MNNALTREFVEKRIDKNGGLNLRDMGLKEVPSWIDMELWSILDNGAGRK